MSVSRRWPSRPPADDDDDDDDARPSEKDDDTGGERETDINIVARPGSRLLGFRRTHVERARPSIGPSASLPCSLLSLPLFSLFRPARSTTRAS